MSGVNLVVSVVIVLLCCIIIRQLVVLNTYLDKETYNKVHKAILRKQTIADLKKRRKAAQKKAGKKIEKKKKTQVTVKTG